MSTAEYRDIWLCFTDNHRFPAFLYEDKQDILCILKLKKYAYLVIDHAPNYYLTHNRDGSTVSGCTHNFIPNNAKDLEYVQKIARLIMEKRRNGSANYKKTIKEIWKLVDEGEKPYLQFMKEVVFKGRTAKFEPNPLPFHYPNISATLMGEGATATGCNFQGCQTTGVYIREKSRK
jgi:hypothetical protein